MGDNSFFSAPREKGDGSYSPLAGGTNRIDSLMGGGRKRSDLSRKARSRQESLCSCRIVEVCDRANERQETLTRLAKERF